MEQKLLISEELEKKDVQECRSFKDICYDPDYVALYEKKEKGKAKTFHFESEHGEIEHSYLVREIPQTIDGRSYYDITSAYGYGGPVIKRVNDPEKLFEEYNEAFSEECERNNIVSAFYRFHLKENQMAVKYFDGEIHHVGPHVVRDLTQPIKKNMHKSIGNSVRKAEKKGMRVEFDDSNIALSSFLKVYQETMDRTGATDYYNYDVSFFRKLQEKFRGQYIFSQALIEDEVVASFLTLIGEEYSFGFLGGTLTDYLAYDASTFLEFHTISWLKERGLQYYILGGGVNGEDGLFRFKKKFDKTGIYPFYIGNRIYNEMIYDRLVESRKSDATFSSDDVFFPLYRKGSQ